MNNQKNNTSYEYKIDGIENVDQITETKDGTVKIIEILYNSRHQLVKYNGMDLSYDNNGNLTQYKHNYSYNWNNQLAKVTTGTGVNIEYKYDALGRRIVKKVKDPDSGFMRQAKLARSSGFKSHAGKAWLAARYSNRISGGYKADEAGSRELPGRNNVNVISLEIDVVEEADSVS